MTDAVQIALIVAIPPTVTAVCGVGIAIVNNRRATEKLEHITVLTNSTLTAANTRIDELEKQVLSLTSERGR